MAALTVAAAQYAPVLLDRDATLDRVEQVARDAVSQGVDLLAFPETFVPGYPDWVWRARPWDGDSQHLYARLTASAVEVPGPAADRLGAIARENGLWLSVGVTEKAGSTLYNSLLWFAPDGTLTHRHRKLMPTGGERLVWGYGDGSTLSVLDTDVGRLGGLICWENYMPLARAALYGQGIEVYLAPTWDTSDVWVPTLQHIAKEGRCFVIGVCQAIRAADLPVELPARELWGQDEWLARGLSTVVAPGGEILAGPLVESEGLVIAAIDTALVAQARGMFDPTGHYGRPDVLSLTVDSRPKRSVILDDDRGRGPTPRLPRMSCVTAQKLDGTATATAIKDELRSRIAALAAKGVVPGLGTVLVGDDPGSRWYVNGKHKDCAEVGIASIRVDLPETASQEEIEAAVADLNADPACTGYIVQLPLPRGRDENRVLGLIDPAKDADGLHPTNLGWLVLGTPAPLPCTPYGIVELLRRHGVAIEGAEVCVVGRGVTVGRPLGLLLTRRSENATVTLCHTGTVDLAAHVRKADIVVAAAGVPGIITAAMVKPGAAVLDVGVSRVDGKIAGDVADDVWDVAGWVSPNPGGVGPMTRAMLLANVVSIAEGRLQEPVRA